MIPMRKYEYVIIRNDKEIGINEYGFDYLINLEKVLDEIRTYIEKHRQIYDIDGSIEKQIDEFDILASPKRILEMIDKVKE